MKTGYFFVLKDISKGKLCSQILHAGESLYEKGGKTHRKIVYKVDTLELVEVENIILRNKLVLVKINDAGLTQVKPGTLTVVATCCEETNIFNKYKLF